MSNRPAEALAALLFLAFPLLTSADTGDEIRRLVRQLGDDRFQAREEASQRLVAIGKPALAPLQQATESADPEVRKRAQDAIDAILVSVNYLIEALRDSDVAIRRRAAEAIERGDSKDRRLVAALVPALKDRDQQVVESAINALVRLDPDLPALAAELPKQATVDGKYRHLQRRIKVAEDRTNYSDYRDFGLWDGAEYYGHTDLPRGYWVYVYPHWYIWRDLSADK
jgi:hypothetical protein